MADTHGTTATHSSNNFNDNPNHLNTTIESGTFDEKTNQNHDPTPAKKSTEDEEEDEDMDALIDELESQDGHAEDDEEEHEASPATGRVVPEDQLQTDPQIGLTEAEVHQRRKKYGLNQMKEEKENLFFKFLWYFVGPIQFVMEVCPRFEVIFPLAIHPVSRIVRGCASPLNFTLRCYLLVTDEAEYDPLACTVLTSLFLIGRCYTCCWSPRLG